MVCAQWKFIFVNNFVFTFYKQEQQVSFSTCKKVMVVKKQKWLGKLDVKVNTKLSANQKNMKLEDLGVTKRIGKSIHLYNKVQKSLPNEIFLKFVVAVLKIVRKNTNQLSRNFAGLCLTKRKKEIKLKFIKNHNNV